MARSADWYFDVISPFAYLQFMHFHRLPDDLEVTLKPVLFAGLLGHWEHKGPAEIPAKRTQTYRYTHWLAEQLGVPFRTPPAHPFIPLKPLRLILAGQCSRDIVAASFDYIWGQGGDVNDDVAFEQFFADKGFTEALANIGDATVKQALRSNTEEAVARGVYGVPTYLVEDEAWFGREHLPRVAWILSGRQGPAPQVANLRFAEGGAP